MKRGYLWLDWVELGCRGWHLDETGAGLDDEWQPERCCPDDYAHLDRRTLRLLFHGCRPFVTRVLNDMKAAGLWHFQQSLGSDTGPRWTLPLTDGTTTSGSSVGYRLTIPLDAEAAA